MEIFNKKIVVLSWWPWLEREIAKKSADFVKKNLNRDFDYYELPSDLELFLENKDKYNLAIPVFHWEYWEDWKIFAFLEILWIPYTFSDYSVHSLCLDKFKTNILVSSLWINIPEQFIIDSTLENKLNSYPVIVKPNSWWSSFHTYKVKNQDDYNNKIKIMKKELNDNILVQDFIAWDEYSVPMVSWKILPIMKLEKEKDEFFDYEAKYENNSEIKEIFPEIENNLKSKLVSASKIIHDFFNIKSVCRIDFLVRDNEIYFLEVNTIPWMTDASILPKAWSLTGKNSTQLVTEIIN